MVKGVGMAEVVASLQTQHTVYDVKDLCSYFQSSKTFLQSAVKGKKASDVCRLERRNNNALDFFSLSVAAVSASVPQCLSGLQTRPFPFEILPRKKRG